MKDLRVTSEALEWQAEIADAAGRHQLAENLRRASELARVPEDKILQIYQMLRPGRASEEALMKAADDLETQFQALRCAQFVREAARAYFKRSEVTLVVSCSSSTNFEDRGKAVSKCPTPGFRLALRLAGMTKW